MVEFPQRLERFDGTHIVVGVENTNPEAPLGFDQTLVEALAVLPWSEGGGVELGAAVVFEPSPEAAAIIAAATGTGG